MELDEKWIRAHLPEESRNDPLPSFSGYYLDGLKVMSEGERGDPDKVAYEAKTEEDLLWWQLEYVCHFVGKAPDKKIWRWYRDRAVDGHFTYIEHRHYDYDAVENPRLAGFECFLRNLHFGFPAELWEQRVQYHIRLMNRWYKTPHWDYDRERLCFIEISHSKEYSSDFDDTEEPRDGSVIKIID